MKKVKIDKKSYLFAKLKKDSNFWMFGIHAIRSALMNKNRKKLRLKVSQNAFNKLEKEIAHSKIKFEIIDLKTFKSPLPSESVHQGALLEVEPLSWPSLSEICSKNSTIPSRIILLDRVNDPHNVGAILRTAEVFGTTAVIVPKKHSPPENGSLAKSASGALERQPYIPVPNLTRVILSLKKMGYTVVGLDAFAKTDLKTLQGENIKNLVLIFGSEGMGLRRLTAKSCDFTVKITASNNFSSLNVSNAVSIGLYATSNPDPLD